MTKISDEICIDAMNKLQSELERSPAILQEAGVVERLRRGGEEGVGLHPRLAHALAIYDAGGARALRSIFSEYIGVARGSGLPILLCTPTWRANRERVEESGAPETCNEDAVGFMRDLAADEDYERVLLAGLVSCRNDCYQLECALSPDEAREFHSWQLRRLADGRPDFLLATTMPAVCEAVGMAQAMAETGLPFVVSFVLGRDGRVLDGASLPDAARAVDEACGDRRPVGYMINCCYPTFLAKISGAELRDARLMGLQANGSSLDPRELDAVEVLQMEPVETWGRDVLEFRKRSGIQIVGGCCGTDGRHLSYLASRLGRGGES